MAQQTHQANTVRRVWPIPAFLVDARSRFLLSTVSLDLLTMAGAVLLGSYHEFGVWMPTDAPLLPNQNIRPLLVALFVSVGLGSWLSQVAIRQGVPRPSVARAMMTFVFTLSAVSVTAVLSRIYYSRQFTVAAVVTWFVAALAIRAFRARAPWEERVWLITHEKELVEHLRHAPHTDIEAVLGPMDEAPEGPPSRGTTLVTDLRAVLSDSMASFVTSVNIAGYNVRSLTSVYEEHTGRVPLVHLAEGWEISNPFADRAPFQPLKGATDIVLIVLTSPIWLVLAAVTALLVRLFDGGPVLFRQERVGLEGRPFTLYKLRTMRVGSEDEGPSFTLPDDPRITPIGRILRKTRLDEIPQLWNVLRGEMSLVGPRAEQPSFVRSFEDQIPFYGYRHSVRPGITGWAQVNSGYADDLEGTITKLSYDLYYVRHMSPSLDLTIMWRSVMTVLTGRGR